MNSKTIIQIAFRAFDRGFLDTKGLHDAIRDSNKSEWIDPDAFWAGRLGREQLVAIAAELDGVAVGDEDGPQTHFSIAPEELDEAGLEAGGESVSVSLRSTAVTPAPAVAPTQRPPAPHAMAPVQVRVAPVAQVPVEAPPEPPPAVVSAGISTPRRQQEKGPSRHARFTRLGVLGTGGMGEVFEYEDTYIGRRVAVKTLRNDVASRATAETMLEREARITGSLEHPNIIPVYDAGRDPGRGPFFMMRVLKEPPLNEVLRKLRAGDPHATARYPLGRLLRYFIPVCQAVDYAHSRGVVHCDLKPANILLGPFGEVLVVDWGFAQRMDEHSAHRGGTPGYMAPEQLDARAGRVDGRSDVFALGAILYELLTLRKAFPARPMHEFLDALKRGESLFPPPKPPRVAAPHRNVAPEAEEICLRAVELDQRKRFQSAREMADALEQFLEGTKERDRRVRRAIEFTAQGDALAESHEELMASRPERNAEVAALRASIASWESPEQKQELWDAEDRQAVLSSLCIRTFQAAVSAYEHALDEVSGHAPARKGLARLYWGELTRSQERRDEFDRVYFEGMVNQYDDGTYADRLRRIGSLYVECRPSGATVVLEHHAEQNRRLGLVREEELGPAPARIPDLDPGHYVARLERPNLTPVRYPVLVRPGQESLATVLLDGAADLDAGEAFVPGGPALLGGHDASLFGREVSEVEVASFVIALLPVSFGDYLTFLEEAFADNPDTAVRYLACTGDGAPYWEWKDGMLVPTRIARWGGKEPTWLSYPVFGVDLECATAYAAWKSAKTGRHYRLPVEAEWEKAARGTDGRLHPWGDRFDASFCKMRESRPRMAAPEPSGAFETDVSPYGVRDMAGGIAEWALPAVGGTFGGQVASRGGAWCDWASDCHLGARRNYPTSEKSARVGFRLVRDVVSPAPARPR